MEHYVKYDRTYLFGDFLHELYLKNVKFSGRIMERK